MKPWIVPACAVALAVACTATDEQALSSPTSSTVDLAAPDIVVDETRPEPLIDPVDTEDTDDTDVDTDDTDVDTDDTDDTDVDTGDTAADTDTAAL